MQRSPVSGIRSGASQPHAARASLRGLLSSLLAASLTAPLLVGCDPGQGTASPAPSASASATPSTFAPASAGQKLNGVYDYGQVVSLDDPDGPPRVLTFAITTPRKLKGIEASLVSEEGQAPLSALGLDFKTHSLVLVVRPGSGPPPEILGVKGSGESARVEYRVPPPAGESSESGRGRYTALVVSPPIPGSTSFVDLGASK